MSELISQSSEYLGASVFDYHQSYLSRKVRPSDVIKIALSRSVEWELARFPIFSSLNESDVLEQAAKSDARYLQGTSLSVLDGVPIAFKDVVNIRNHVTRNGKKPSVSWTSGSGVVTEDTIVKRFRDLGCIIFGITIMTGMTLRIISVTTLNISTFYAYENCVIIDRGRYNTSGI